MAAAGVSNNPLPQSKSSSENQQNASPSISNASKTDIGPQRTSTAESTDNNDNPYFKELQRSLRNAVKKLNSTARVDAIVADNPGKSLDELVAEKKINPDQKAQILKKPTLQANVAQIEEQISHYKQFAGHYEERLASQKATLEKAHRDELDAVRRRAVAEATESSKKELENRLLSLSRFLCAAAAMRRSGDETSNESRAFEGVLYQVYGGCREAVTSMVKLIDGVDENVLTVEGDVLDFTYGKVKLASEEYTKATEEPSVDGAPVSDPTMANAAYTELQDSSLGANSAATNEPVAAAASLAEQIPPPAQSLVSDAANPVAESNWDSNISGSLSSSANADGWVEVPRDPAETDVGLQATASTVDTGLKNNPTAAQSSGQSGEGAIIPDGSEQAAHHQRQPSVRGRGGARGRGRGDGFRGRGRGDFRGRGRGRGGRGRGGTNGAPAAGGTQ
ncbi:hypothetical protein PHISCL_05148 [Aspergillus sclerotialis]|uniref:YAG7-like dimerisation domain-containing protein n=1 Tax=Aspergillus sclerotialis TaxID=2070753 RepID=A0A3A2ZWY2_9EURO|nr:hypothetical protein PHISCL_05148 [Aspergillus sclerotialis]